MFIDELELFVKAGDGGGGATSFRREKYVEFGGPDGGDGGHGGDVIVRVRPDFNTLLPLRNRRHYRAENGTKGKGSNMYGARGENLVLEVPRGTIIRDRESGSILADLTGNLDSVIIAKGGIGGKGNKHFASSTNRAPRYSQPGESGEERWLKFELKIMADIGLVGFPNAGKSTLISRVSAAKPKVAGYPFTTLEPSLGVVQVSLEDAFVIADIPGIIEGAHVGVGLGLRFLKHIERTSLLLILIDPADPERTPATCYEVLRRELNAYSEKLAKKPFAVAFTKADIPLEDQSELNQLRNHLTNSGVTNFYISSIRGDGLQTLIYDLFELVQKHAAESQTLEAPETPADTKHETIESGQLAQPDPAEEIDPLDEI